MKKHSEMIKLMKLLDEHNIPYEETINTIDNSIQLWYPNKNNAVSDAICHKYSYGYEEGLLEIMGLVDVDKIGDTVEGHLTAEEVFDRWSKHYKESKK